MVCWTLNILCITATVTLSICLSIYLSIYLAVSFSIYIISTIPFSICIVIISFLFILSKLILSYLVCATSLLFPPLISFFKSLNSFLPSSSFQVIRLRDHLCLENLILGTPWAIQTQMKYVQCMSSIIGENVYICVILCKCGKSYMLSDVYCLTDDMWTPIQLAKNSLFVEISFYDRQDILHGIFCS